MHDLNLPEGHGNRIRSFGDTAEFERACEEQLGHTNPSLLLFLSGKDSAQWLASIGWRCGVDPEFWLRHLDFCVANSEFFTLPALPSSTRNIIRLRATNIGIREHDGLRTQKELSTLRKTIENQMRTYLSLLKRDTSIETGTSVVRSFALNDLEHFSLEQEISICVNAFGRGWIGDQTPLPTGVLTNRFD
jgi:hypothetical protein